MELLTTYLHTHFGSGNTVLLERQVDFVRFKFTNKQQQQQQVSEPSQEDSHEALRDEPSGDEPSGGEPSVKQQATNFRLSRMFEVVESEKQRLLVHECSISQTSLEQIFNAFTRPQQHEETRVVNGLVVE